MLIKVDPSINSAARKAKMLHKTDDTAIALVAEWTLKKFKGVQKVQLQGPPVWELFVAAQRAAQ